MINKSQQGLWLQNSGFAFLPLKKIIKPKKYEIPSTVHTKSIEMLNVGLPYIL